MEDGAVDYDYAPWSSAVTGHRQTSLSLFSHSLYLSVILGRSLALRLALALKEQRVTEVCGVLMSVFDIIPQTRAHKVIHRERESRCCHRFRFVRGVGRRGRKYISPLDDT